MSTLPTISICCGWIPLATPVVWQEAPSTSIWVDLGLLREKLPWPSVDLVLKPLPFARIKLLPLLLPLACFCFPLRKILYPFLPLPFASKNIAAGLPSLAKAQKVSAPSGVALHSNKILSFFHDLEPVGMSCCHPCQVESITEHGLVKAAEVQAGCLLQYSHLQSCNTHPNVPRFAFAQPKFDPLYFFDRHPVPFGGLRHLRLTRLLRHDRSRVPGENRSAVCYLRTVLRQALYLFFPSNAFMASARSFNMFNSMLQLGLLIN